MFAEADHHHFQQTALDGAVEAGVGFDAANDADMVGIGGVPIEKDGVAVRCRADFDDVHGSKDGSADVLFGDAVAFQDPALSVSSGAAVATHSRNEERASTKAVKELTRCTKDVGDAGDATAAGGQGDALAGPNPPLQGEAREGVGDGRLDVFNTLPFKLLPQPHHP
jgi:hypothetical protein